MRTIQTSKFVTLDPEIYRSITIGMIIMVYLSVMRYLIFSVTGFLFIQFDTNLPLFVIALSPVLVSAIPRQFHIHWKELVPSIPFVWILAIWIIQPVIMVILYIVLTSLIVFTLPNLFELQFQYDKKRMIMQSFIIGFSLDLIVRGLNDGIDPMIYSKPLPAIIISIFILPLILLTTPDQTDHPDPQPLDQVIPIAAIRSRNFAILAFFVGMMTYMINFANAGLLASTFLDGGLTNQTIYHFIFLSIFLIFTFYRRRYNDLPNRYFIPMAIVFLVISAFYPWRGLELLLLPIGFILYLLICSRLLYNADVIDNQYPRSLRVMVVLGLTINIVYMATIVQIENYLFVISLPLLFVAFTLISMYYYGRIGQ